MGSPPHAFLLNRFDNYQLFHCILRTIRNLFWGFRKMRFKFLLRNKNTIGIIIRIFRCIKNRPKESLWTLYFIGYFSQVFHQVKWLYFLWSVWKIKLCESLTSYCLMPYWVVFEYWIRLDILNPKLLNLKSLISPTDSNFITIYNFTSSYRMEK